MKKILLILVGGTICTAINEEGNLAVSEKAGVLLKKNYLTSDSLYVNDVEIESTENLYILSENMTVDKWNEIIALYRKYVDEKDRGGDLYKCGRNYNGSRNGYIGVFGSTFFHAVQCNEGSGFSGIRK